MVPSNQKFTVALYSQYGHLFSWTFTSPFVSNELKHTWASEASPTLGCSIEISRDIQCIQLVKYKNHRFLPFCYFPLQIERK